ncbi:MAG: NAD(P)-binding protein [Desulfobacteraceae bacterium]|jgi:flavin-dependent dehydrogenase
MPIRILGGGISGLTAAINLKRAGFDVEVHERKDYCGKQAKDFQFLENWTSNEDVLDALRAMHIETDFYVKPWYSQEILSPSFKKFTGTSTQPLMYLIKRGQREGSIDKALEEQTKKSKIRIFYNSNLQLKEADIIATGLKSPTFVVTGIMFRLKHPDKSIVLLDNNLSYRCYSYFIVNDNRGEIACGNPKGLKGYGDRLALTVKKFEQILRVNIENIEERFTSVVNFGFLHQAKGRGQYFVGEAAGFQDQLAGFGMGYAFKSGYYAARSIIESVDYDRLWQEDFLKPLKISSRNRWIYDRLSNEDFERFVDILRSRNPLVTHLRGGDDMRSIMRMLYSTSISLFHAYFMGRTILRSMDIRRMRGS